VLPGSLSREAARAAGGGRGGGGGGGGSRSRAGGSGGGQSSSAASSSERTTRKKHTKSPQVGGSGTVALSEMSKYGMQGGQLAAGGQHSATTSQFSPNSSLRRRGGGGGGGGGGSSRGHSSREWSAVPSMESAVPIDLPPVAAQRGAMPRRPRGYSPGGDPARELPPDSQSHDGPSAMELRAHADALIAARQEAKARALARQQEAVARRRQEQQQQQQQQRAQLMEAHWHGAVEQGQQTGRSPSRQLRRERERYVRASPLRPGAEIDVMIDRRDSPCNTGVGGKRTNASNPAPRAGKQWPVANMAAASRRKRGATEWEEGRLMVYTGGAIVEDEVPSARYQSPQSASAASLRGRQQVRSYPMYRMKVT
jgi:hypothetical protein